jgi:hypothetical protein
MERTKQCVRIGGPLDNVMCGNPHRATSNATAGAHSRQPSGYHHRDVRLVPRASSSLVLRPECADRVPAPVIDLVGLQSALSHNPTELARLVFGELVRSC